MKRMAAYRRYQQIFDVATHIARAEGFGAITQRRIARACGISGPAVQHHVKDMDALRRQVFLSALDRQDLVTVGRAVAAGYLAPEPIRSEALRAAFG